MKANVTQYVLKSSLKYECETGCFTWIAHTSNRVRVGDIAGTLMASGYIHIQVKGKLYLAHRLAWLYMHGKFPNECIDHINGIKTDNRICNLREATKSENLQNIRKANKNNKSGYLGVSFVTRDSKWVAEIRVDGKIKRLGYFLNPESAHTAYLSAKRKDHKFCTI